MLSYCILQGWRKAKIWGWKLCFSILNNHDYGVDLIKIAEEILGRVKYNQIHLNPIALRMAKTVEFWPF